MKLIIPPPIVALVCAGLLWTVSRHFTSLNIQIPWQNELAIFIAVIGIAIDIAAMRLFIRFKTTISPLSPAKTSDLVTTGIYRISRNPMYLGMALLICAFGTWLGTLATPVVLILFCLYLNRFQIFPEEAALHEIFGDAYKEYCERTRRWI